MIRPGRISVGATAVFATRTLALVLTAATTFVLARLLAPSDLGGYYLLVLLPPSMLALFSFGLPGSLTYHAGRGNDLDEVRSLAVGLGLGLSAAIVAMVLLLQPVLAATVLAAAPRSLIPLSAAAIPGTFVASFCGAVILGRQRLRAYNALVLGHGIALVAGQLLVVGVAHGGLVGAVATYVAVATAMGLAGAVLMLRVAPYHPRGDRRIARSLAGYGLRLQPASLAGFFSYRADVFLMSALLRDSTALGVYGLAVNIAELVFYIPDAVATVLFPRVAASDRAEAANLVPAVSRTTLLLTAAAAVALALVTVVAVPLLLPAYTRSIVPALILLPGIVGLSASKVLSGYLSGIGRPGPISIVAATMLVLNLALNLVLIPAFGPSGASTASLVSYSLNGAIMVILGSRQAGVPVRAMILPRRADLERLRRTLASPLESRLNR